MDIVNFYRKLWNILQNVFAWKVSLLYVDVWNRSHFCYKSPISLETSWKQRVTSNLVLNPVLCVAFNEHLYVARLRSFWTIVLGLNLLFFRYLSKIDASTHLRLYFKHICVVLLFFDFPRKLPLRCKKEQIWVISITWPPGSGQFDTVLTYVIKVDKREVLRLYFKHNHVVLLFFVYPGRLPLFSQNK